MEVVVLTRCQSALRSQTAATARQRRRQLSQLLELQMEVGMRIKLLITKVFRKISRMGKDRIMPIIIGTTVVEAAAVPMMIKMVPVHAK
jgi:hypothetical protein